MIFGLFTGSEAEPGTSAQASEVSAPRQRDAKAAESGPIVSYAMNREDVLLHRIFGKQITGFYVDVGANSPKRFSNTKHFYDQGWRGINIEPSRAFDELAVQRPRDINLRLVATDRDGSIAFHECSDSSLSSVDERGLPKGFLLNPPVVVPARSLKSIFDEHVEGPIDFMSVDVEGHERQVLEGNDWTCYRPRVLIIEATQLLRHHAAHETWENILFRADYLFAYFDGVNRFYVRKEDADLLGYFAFPPTSLEYTPAEVVELRQKLQDCRRESPRRIWFDLTTLVLFPNNITGIPRVVTKVLEALLPLDQVKTKLCLYDYTRKRFVKVTHKPTRLHRLGKQSKKILEQLYQPLRPLGDRFSEAWSRAFSSARQRLSAWVSRKPWRHMLAKRLQFLVGYLGKVLQLLARGLRWSLIFLRALSIGIRNPQDPAVISTKLLFPFCLLCHNFLKLLPARSWWRLHYDHARMRHWFELPLGGGTWVRGTRKPVEMSAGDVVVQVGWNPQQQGIAAAKRKQGFRYVSLVHDLIPVKLPHFVPREYPARYELITREQLANSDLILVNSQCTLRDLEEFAWNRVLTLPPIHVLRFGSEVHNVSRPSNTSPVEGVVAGEPFVLTVSTVDPRKNHTCLYNVWRKLAAEFGERTPKLIVVGYPGLQQLLHEMKCDPLVRGKILHAHPIDDRQLDWLYRNCLFTAYPSHYEGWGLPVSESLWYRKLCIASDSSSIPEIGGNCVDYHCPDDFGECHRLIRRAAFDAEYRKLREEHIASAYRPTTWRDCAESLCSAIFEQVKLSRASAPTSHERGQAPCKALKKAG